MLKIGTLVTIAAAGIAPYETETAGYQGVVCEPPRTDVADFLTMLYELHTGEKLMAVEMLTGPKAGSIMSAIMSELIPVDEEAVAVQSAALSLA